jgi:hypothetical protein
MGIGMLIALGLAWIAEFCLATAWQDLDTGGDVRVERRNMPMPNPPIPPGPPGAGGRTKPFVDGPALICTNSPDGAVVRWTLVDGPNGQMAVPPGGRVVVTSEGTTIAIETQPCGLPATQWPPEPNVPDRAGAKAPAKGDAQMVAARAKVDAQIKAAQAKADEERKVAQEKAIGN